MSKPEKTFEEEIKNYLRSIGIYPLGIEKQKIKVRPIGYYEKRWGNAYTGAGLPDLHIVIHGISIEVEIKAAKGKPGKLQIKKLNQIVNSGGIGFVLYPKDFEKFKEMMSSMKVMKKPLCNHVISYAFGDWDE